MTRIDVKTTTVRSEVLSRSKWKGKYPIKTISKGCKINYMTSIHHLITDKDL